MKIIKTFLFAFLFVISSACVGAYAGEDSRVDRLLELLVQKGVITSDEATDLKKEVSAPEQVVAAPPALKPPSINFSGYMKLQSQWTENGATSNNDTFRVRQARLIFSGEPAQRLSYRINIGLERTDPTLLESSVTYKLSPELALVGGQFKVPISRESIASGRDLDLLERASFIDQFRFTNGYDQGFKLTWNPDPDLMLEVGAFNGTGKNTTDSNDQKSWVSRLSGTVNIGSLRIEPEIAYLRAPSEDAANPLIEQSLRSTPGFAPYDKSLKQWGLAAFHSTLSIKHEYIQGRFQPKNSVLRSVIADGMFIQLGAALSQKCDGFLRFETFDRDLNTTTNTDTQWTTIGLKIQKYKNLRYKLNYTWKKEVVSSDDNDVLGMEMILLY
ncbi:MAG: porin [bacterium]